MIGSLLALAACAPRYHHLPPMAPDALWTPYPPRTVAVEMPGPDDQGEDDHVEDDRVEHGPARPDARSVEITYVDSGAAGVVPADPEAPPLVFVHGLSSWMGFWEHQLPHFAEERRVLALDLPGYGMSGRPDAPYTPPWYADVLAAWMDEVGLESAVIVGHSMGGQIAMTFALAHPDRVAGLVLAAPAGFERFSPGAARWMKQYWTEDRALHAREEELRATFTTVVFNRPDEGVERLLRERVQLGRHPAFAGTSVAVSRSIAGMVDHPVRDRLAELAAPTLIVYGTDDRMIPNPVFTGGRTQSVAEQGHALIPDSQLVMLRGAGHTVHHDDPQGFNEAVDWFLAGKTTPRGER